MLMWPMFAQIMHMMAKSPRSQTRELQSSSSTRRAKKLRVYCFLGNIGVWLYVDSTFRRPGSEFGAGDALGGPEPSSVRSLRAPRIQLQRPHLGWNTQRGSKPCRRPDTDPFRQETRRNTTLPSLLCSAWDLPQSSRARPVRGLGHGSCLTDAREWRSRPKSSREMGSPDAEVDEQQSHRHGMPRRVSLWPSRPPMPRMSRF